MTELKGHFERADLLPAPDLWEEARRRSTGPRPLPPGPPGASRAKRIAAASVALAVFAAAAVFAWDTLRPEGAPVQEPDVKEVTGGAFDDLPAEWTELPPPPDVRTGAATAWTGTELLVWGGFTDFDERNVLADGFVFDATERAWRPTALAPLAPRTLSASAWTGSELLVWGGWRGIYGVEYAREFFDDGAAYDPVSDTWRVLPRAPIDARAPLSVWTGQELLVWGTAVRVDDRPRDGAAYDPASDSWRMIAEAPIELTDATVVWTGKEMIVFGAALCCGNRPESKTAIGAAYDPASDTWRRIPDSELSPQASTAAWNGTEMIAWDYLNGSAAYDPTTDTWRDLPRVPLEDYECSPESVAVGGYFFGDYCGALALYDPVDDAWRDVTRRDLMGWDFEVVPATPAVVLLAKYRLDTSMTRMFAYRPTPTESPSPVNPQVIATIDVGQVTSLLFAEGSLWVGVFRVSGGAGPDEAAVLRIDPATNEVIATIPMKAVPGWEVGGDGMAAGAGAVWVVDWDAVLHRIDPATNEIIEEIPLGGTLGGDVAVHETGVWVSIFGPDQKMKVVRVDPATGAVVATIPIEGDWVREIFAIDGAVFVRSLAQDTIFTVIDPTTNEVVVSRRMGEADGPFVEWDGVIWSGAGRELLRIDPRTAELIGEPIPVGKGISALSLVVGEGGIWFVGYEPDDESVPATIDRFNPATGEVDVSVDPPKGPVAMTMSPGSIWVLNYEGSVTRIGLH